MKEIDKAFHGSDPATGRPMSLGHPDGVWFMGIVYCMLIVGTAVSVLLNSQHFQQAGILGPISVATLVTICLLYLVSIVLAAKKSSKVMIPIALLLFLTVMGSVLTYFLDAQNAYLSIIPAVVNAYALIYCQGLKRDGFLV